MARILIIADEWPQRAPGAGLLHAAIRGAGVGVSVIASEKTPADAPRGDDVILVPFEAPKRTGRLFELRNALFFDGPANPGNYAMLRDTLHLHLQEVLYDAVLILCPPAIYLKLAYWIDLSFGIPVWLHLSSPFPEGGSSAFHRWNHARLRRKYLGAARLTTAEEPQILEAVPVQEYQLKLLAVQQATGVALVDAVTGNQQSMNEVLQMLIPRKPQR